MVSINYAFREISCKVVYYGPGLSGKTTNLQYVHDRVPAKSRGKAAMSLASASSAGTSGDTSTAASRARCRCALHVAWAPS